MITDKYEKITEMNEAIKVCSLQKIKWYQKNAAHRQFYENVIRKILPIIKDELVKFLPEWLDLLPVHDFSVAVHTLNVLYLVTKDPNFQGLSQNH